MDQLNTVNCSDCQAANQPEARYCEQCGALLPAAGGSGEKSPAQLPGRSLNWLGLLGLLVVIVAIAWFNLRGSSGVADNPAPPVQAANPHGTSADAADVTRILEESRSRLAADPLDTAALNEMYEMYGGIGEAEKMQPFASAAVEAWLAQDPATRELKKISDVAMIASQNNDLESAVLAFSAFHGGQPENMSVAATIGNLYFQLSRRELPGSEQARAQARLAIEWYDRFLAGATPESHTEQYWNVMVDKASMQISLLDEQDPQYDEAIALLGRVTNEAPEFWMGWHNLGLAHKLAGNDAAAISALGRAKEQAGSPRERWESEQQLAILENREADPGDFDPTDPHSGLDMGGSELPGAAEGMPNPHSQGDMANPHGTPPANPHGGADA